MADPRRSFAVIVGIDAYSMKPLESCVNDAMAFHKALLSHGLVDPMNIVMLLCPGPAGVPGPTRDEIADALYDVYRNGDALERFFFYFAGHGVLRHSDAARTKTSSVLIPVDVKDLDQHGARLIDLNDLVDRFACCGPREQLFIVDACRDMPYEKEPDVGSLGWAAREPGEQRRQAVLQAVPPLGKALGEAGGQGVFTSHLLDALSGKGTAKEYDDRFNGYVVHVKSAMNYVRTQVERSLVGVSRWQLYINLPVVGGEGYAEMEPLRRSLGRVADVPFVIHVEPEAAAATTTVSVVHRGIELVNQRLPPRQNHQPVPLRPDLYRLRAASTTGSVRPTDELVDIRDVDSHTVRVDQAGDIPRVPVVPGLLAPVAAIVTRSRAPDSPRSEKGQPARGKPKGAIRMARIEVHALEPETSIEVEGLSPPVVRRDGVGNLEDELPPGAYEVRFRLGADVFSRVRLEVDPGETATVTPNADLSPLLSEALGIRTAETVEVSESIGAIQAGLLPTVLTLLGLKAFDHEGKILSRFENLVPRLSAEQFGDHPVAVVVAYDGDGWPADPHELVSAIRLTIGGEPLPLHALETPQLQWSAGVLGEGFRRVAVAFAKAPASSFPVELAAPEFGDARFFSASLDRRVSVAALALYPDGRIDISQSLLRVPYYQYPEEPDVDYLPSERPGPPAARIVRNLILGQRLYASRDLMRITSAQGNSLLSYLLYAKWTDPIVSTMALLAHRPFAWPQRNEEMMPGLLYPPVDMALGNLITFFGRLPDVQVVYMLYRDPRFGGRPADQAPGGRQMPDPAEVLEALVSHEQVPVLLDAARALLGMVRELGLSHARLEDAVRRARPGDVWTLAIAPKGTQTPAPVEGSEKETVLERELTQ